MIVVKYKLKIQTLKLFTAFSLSQINLKYKYLFKQIIHETREEQKTEKTLRHHKIKNTIINDELSRTDAVQRSQIADKLTLPRE